MDGSEVLDSARAVVAGHRFMVGGMSVVKEQVERVHALMGFVMRQASRNPRGADAALHCWEIRRELEDFGAGDDPDVLFEQANRPPAELLEDALDALEAIPPVEFPPVLAGVVSKIVGVKLRMLDLQDEEEAVRGDHC